MENNSLENTLREPLITIKNLKYHSQVWVYFHKSITKEDKVIYNYYNKIISYKEFNTQRIWKYIFKNHSEFWDKTKVIDITRSSDNIKLIYINKLFYKVLVN